MSLSINQKKYSKVVSITPLLLAVALWYWLNNMLTLPITKPSVEQPAQYQQQRILRFSYEISNTSNQPLTESVFSSYLPVAIMSNQQADTVKTLHNFKEELGELGNRVGHFDLGFISPYGKKVINFVAKINTAEQANTLSINKVDNYLIEEPYIELSHPTIQKLSQRLQGQDNQQSIARIYQWVSQRVQYAGYIAQDRGALYAIENLKGDCTEYAYAVVALARSLGIPARVIGGYVYNNNQVVSPVDYHNWAEVYLNGAWHIVDAQKKNFMKNTEDYIAMRILSDASASLLGSSHRFSTANNNLKVTMNK